MKNAQLLSVVVVCATGCLNIFYFLCMIQPLLRSTSFTSETIRKASVQWYKMKWQFTGSANDLWGEEVQGYAVIGDTSPLAGGSELFRPRKVNQIRVRFFNLSRGDDASDDFRCAFLKVSATDTRQWVGGFDTRQWVTRQWWVDLIRDSGWVYLIS